MFTLLKRLIFIVVALFVAHYLFRSTMLTRFTDHWNGCTEQLHTTEKLKTQDDAELDQALADLRGCVVEKTTLVDELFFSKTDIDKTIAALRMMNRSHAE